jgi:NarL family two-component system response regulator LiaR
VIRVLVVDDHAVVRQGLRFVLDQDPDIAVVGESPDGSRALADVRALAPDVVLLDLLMPPPDGLAVLAALGRDHPGTGVVVLTSSTDDEHVVAALRGGALSYLPKTAGVDEITAAVRAAARGEGLLSGKDLARLLLGRAADEQGALELLSPRELDVLSMLARGRSNREIARHLTISEETVKTHVSRILAKLGVADRTQAAIVALQHRLVPLDAALDP